MPDQPPNVDISEQELRTAGFTDTSGIPRFKETVKDYSNSLFEKAVHYGDADKAKNLPREITHEHVRNAALSLFKSYGKSAKSNRMIIAQIGEYVFTAIAGVGGGHLDNQLGIIAFGLGLTFALILIVIRLTKE